MERHKKKSIRVIFNEGFALKGFKLFDAVEDIEEVLPEIEDLSEEEYDELVEYVKGKWDYDEENLDWIVDTAIDAGRGILTIINMQKG